MNLKRITIEKVSENRHSAYFTDLGSKEGWAAGGTPEEALGTLILHFNTNFSLGFEITRRDTSRKPKDTP